MNDGEHRPSRRAQIAWCFFDWANSAFPTVIVTFVFSVYFTKSVAVDEITGTAQWGYALSASGLLIALLSPVLGSWADCAGRRKPWLATFTALTVCSAAMLWFVYPDPSYVLFALVVLVIANTFFEVGQAFYNSMLPSIAPASSIGRLSGFGWGLGYAGGLSCLIVLLFVFIQADPPPFGLLSEELEHVRVVGPFTAVWFALFCLPLFLFVPDSGGSNIGFVAAGRQGIATLIATVRRVRQYKQIAWFLFSRIFYVDGINTMFAFGAIYASHTFGMSADEIIYFAIAMNVVAGLGAAGMAWVDDYLGSKPTVAIALTGLIATGIPLLIVEGKLWFWLLALPMGLFIGGAQSASRSLMAHLAPEEQRTSMFGLFAFSGRITSYVGPFVLATVVSLTESQRAGMTTIVVFIAVGLAILLLKVHPQADQSKISG